MRNLPLRLRGATCRGPGRAEEEGKGTMSERHGRWWAHRDGAAGSSSGASRTTPSGRGSWIDPKAAIGRSWDTAARGSRDSGCVRAPGAVYLVLSSRPTDASRRAPDRELESVAGGDGLGAKLPDGAAARQLMRPPTSKTQRADLLASYGATASETRGVAGLQP